MYQLQDVYAMYIYAFTKIRIYRLSVQIICQILPNKCSVPNSCYSLFIDKMFYNVIKFAAYAQYKNCTKFNQYCHHYTSDG